MDRFWLVRLKNKLFNLDISQPMMRFFGIVMAVNYPVYWIAWHQDFQFAGNELDLILRGIATLLCLGLAFKDSWSLPQSRKLFIYWLVTVIYCLPFFFSFMTLLNHASAVWLMNLISSIFFVFVLFDAGVALVLLVVGSTFGYLAYSLFYPPFYVDLGEVSLFDFVMTLFATIVIGSLFSHKKGIITHEKMMSLRALAGTIAHEMRTPLAVINLEAGWLKNKLSQPKLTQQDINAVNDCPNRLTSTTNNALMIIDMLLANLKIATPREVKLCHISKIILSAIETYPLNQSEVEKIHVDNSHDFEFKGDPDLIRHVIYNLLKNSLYYMKAARKGHIYIWTSRQGRYHCLHFKDTALGVAPEELPNLFTRFYSKRKYGTGLGLAFCRRVMLDLGGKIKCDSVINDYAEFILYFPIDN